MRIKVCVFLALFILVPPFLAVVSPQAPPPLLIDFVVDPKIRQSVGGDEALRILLADIVIRASLIFNAEIGRRLEVGKVWVELPNVSAEQAVVADSAIFWLVERFKSKTESRFIVFLAGRPVFFGLVNLDGYNEGAGGRVSIVRYFGSNPQYTANILLHEIGHNCGAEHTEGRESIMNMEQKNAMSYKESIPVIRENCGAK